MNCLSAKCVLWTLAVAVFSTAYGQEVPTEWMSEATSSSAQPALESRTTVRERLVGTDANDDGIRDDLAEVLSAQDATVASAVAASTVELELARVLASSQPARLAMTRPSCLDYLLMDPKDQAAANRYIQARTNGVFGTHPCDPVVSPLIERPFETDFARLHFGPVQLNYAKYD